MRALVQRVSEARVSVNGEIVGEIETGLLVLLGIGEDDTSTDVGCLAQKVLKLRVFPDDKSRMNRSVKDIGGSVLIVSQFTLYGDTRKGNRPSYSRAADPAKAKELYEEFVSYCRETGITTATGVFQAYMKVTLTNEGPVTLMCSSGE